MKKIFLVCGVFTLYSANAQQKDLFDIEKHLHKKATENNGIKFRLQTFEKFKMPDSSPRTNKIFNSHKGILSHKLPNNVRVFILPIDNMPCIVPDMKEFDVIPNAGINSNIILQNRVGQIPNPAMPFKGKTIR